MSNGMGNVVRGLPLVVGLLALWALVAAGQWISPVFLPGPLAALQSLAQGFVHGDWTQLTLATVERMAWGWLLACAIGVLLGALIGISPLLRAWLQPMLELLRPLPASALVPAAMALFGLTPAMVLAVIGFGSLWPVLLATAHGFATSSHGCWRSAACCGCRAWPSS